VAQSQLHETRGPSTVKRKASVDARYCYFLYPFHHHRCIIYVWHSCPFFLQSFPGTTFAQISAIGTVQLALFFGCGVFAGPLGDRYGARIVCATGGILWSIGVPTTSYVYEYNLLIFTYGILPGIGVSFCYWSTLAVLPQWFTEEKRTRHRSGNYGGGVGQIVYSMSLGPWYQQNWRYMCQTMAGIGSGGHFTQFRIC